MNVLKCSLLFISLCLLHISVFAKDKVDLEKAEKEEAIPYFSVEGSLKTIELQDGYYLEPVLTEPTIKEPVLTVFDGNGKMYVAEMRTYMQDADNTDKFEPTSCVSLHEDTNGDGKMDKHTIFADKLMLPRIVLPLENSVIIGETNTLDLYEYKDIDGDGVADDKKLVYEGGPRGGNLEHQPSGLIWAMDNWLYTTYNTYRLRYKNGKMLKEKTAPNGGQWGLTQDQHGKPWYINAGGERGPVNFQTNITYGAFNVKDQFQGQYKVVWPIDNIPDTQGGEKRLRDDNTLNHFTATCGGEVYRGDRLPKELHGDLFFAEPVGRLIRRTRIEVKDGLSYLSNPYENEKSEFIRSWDPNFRPVNMVTAPDGTLYITDMYRGIIQEGNWTKPGSYLRDIIDKYGMAKNVSRGRIFRLRHKDFKPGPQPRMLDEASSKLVQYLAHPNGWWRDTAQKLLILRGDKSVIPAIKRIVEKNDNYLARMHALWTLEGLEAADLDLLKLAMKDKHPQVRLTAVRVSESIYESHKSTVSDFIKSAFQDKDENVVIQSALTAQRLKIDQYKPQMLSLLQHASEGVKHIVKQAVMPKKNNNKRFSSKQQAMMTKGSEIYSSLCYTCHGTDGKGQPSPGNQPTLSTAGVKMANTLAPSFSRSKRVTGHADIAINIVLHGLTGPLDNKAYPGLMMPMKSYDDKWIAAAVSYVRNSFGNKASFVTPEQVKAVREKTQSRQMPWTMKELEKHVPTFLAHQGWKLTASHKNDQAKNAIEKGKTYRSGEMQDKGMWFQIELPSIAEISGLVLNSGKAKNDYPNKYKVQVSNDGKKWSKPLVQTHGYDNQTQIFFPAVKTRFIRITINGRHRKAKNHWAIDDLNIYGKPVSNEVASRK